MKWFACAALTWIILHVPQVQSEAPFNNRGGKKERFAMGISLYLKIQYADLKFNYLC